MRLLAVSVHPLASVTTKSRSCVRLVSPKGTDDSLKIVFRLVSSEKLAPSTSNSNVKGSSPSDALEVIIFPPLQITFCTE